MEDLRPFTYSYCPFTYTSSFSSKGVTAELCRTKARSITKKYVELKLRFRRD